MSDHSKIEWTDATWNPLLGCDRLTSGCVQCYAVRTAHRLSHNPNPKVNAAYAGLVERQPNGQLNWTGRINLLPERMGQPFRWKTPRRVFVNSQSDLFHEDVPDGFIAWVWYVMAQTPHTYQILTKRPERMRDWVTRWADRSGDFDPDRRRMPRGPAAVRADYTSGRSRLFADMLDQWGQPPPGAAFPGYDWMEGPIYWPTFLRNVWLGVSCEDQKTADERIPLLLETPAAIRWISAEPLLGPIALENPPAGSVPMPSGVYPPWLIQRLNWVVVGGESGPNARPMNPWWARSLRDQCQRNGVAYHFKQWGAWAPVEHDNESSGAYLPSGEWHEFPEEWDEAKSNLWSTGWADPLTLYSGSVKVGKHAAGRLLDGRTWDQWPEVANV